MIAKEPVKNGTGTQPDTDRVVFKDDSILNTDAFIDQLIPVIKKSIKQDSLDDLLNDMEETILNKETELENLSFNSSRDVFTSVSTVKQIKKASEELSQQVMVIQKNLAMTGYELTTKKKILMNYKKIYNKINETTFVLQSCLQILELTNKIMDMISRRNFYNALKALDDLTNLHSSNELFENFEFTKAIFNSIPKLRAMCKDDSILVIKKWLTNSLERNFAKIGESVTVELSHIIENWTEATKGSRHLQKFKVNSAVELSMRPYSEFDPLNEIDLEQLYDGILVYENLAETELLRTEFNSEWLTKRDRLLKDLMKYEPQVAPASAPQTARNGYHRKNSIPTSTFNNSAELRHFMHTVLGFLVSDHLINFKTGYKLRSDTNLKDLYDSLVSKLYPSINSFLNNKVHTLSELEDFKEIVGLFIQSLDSYGYNIDHLYNILIAAYKKFTVLKFEEFKNGYQTIIDSDDSLPMSISDKQLLIKVCNLGWYKLDTSAHISLPKSLPFSSVYPMTCGHLKNHIISHEVFINKYFTHKLSELDKITVASLDNVLSNVVIKYLSTKLDSTIKEEIAQNLINLEFFSNSVKELEKLISDNSYNQLYLNSYANFIKLRKSAESKIFELVDSKVIDLIEFAEWDFRSKEIQQEPSIFIKDIGEFLEMMFNSNFNNLPTSIRQLLLFRSFDLIADHFLEKIRQSSLITSEALRNFDLDVIYLESIINSMNESVKITDQQQQPLSINSTFIELNQVMDLLKSASLQYFKQHQNTKFTRIKVDEVNSLIDKLESVQLERQAQLMESHNGQQHYDEDNSDRLSIISANGNGITDNSSSRFARFKFRNKE